jgi:hypothetical protein
LHAATNAAAPRKDENVNTNRHEALKTAMTDALQGPERTVARGDRLTASVLCRASLAKRLSDAHERAVREAKVLAEEAAQLVVALQCDGISARLSGRTFAGQARKVSGAIIRLTECREVFQGIEAHRDAETLFALPPASREADDAESVEREEDETED